MEDSEEKISDGTTGFSDGRSTSHTRSSCGARIAPVRASLVSGPLPCPFGQFAGGVDAGADRPPKRVRVDAVGRRASGGLAERAWWPKKSSDDRASVEQATVARSLELRFGPKKNRAPQRRGRRVRRPQ